MKQERKHPKDDQVPTKDDRILQQKSKAQKTKHRRSHLTQNHTSNKGLNTGKAWTNLGRTLQDRLLLKTKKLSLGINGWEETATTMEHQAFEKVSSLETNHCCNHKRNHLLKEIKQ